MSKCSECRAFVGHNKACSKYDPTACLQCEHPLLKGAHTCGKSPREPKQEKVMYGSENFPILFENNEVVIFKNPSPMRFSLKVRREGRCE